MDDRDWKRALKTHLAATATHAPRYLRLQQALARLLGEEGARATLLPGERSLASMTGYSRVTVRRALAGLAAAGVVRPRAGSGTYVGERIVRSLSGLTGFTEDLRARGLDPRVVFLERSGGPATAEESRALALSPREPVFRFRRLRFAGNRALALEFTVVPQALLGSADQVEQSLYEALERLGRRPERAQQRIRAVSVDAGAAGLLQIPAGAACLEIERRAFLPDGRGVEFTRSLYRGDSYDFAVELAATPV